MTEPLNLDWHKQQLQRAEEKPFSTAGLVAIIVAVILLYFLGMILFQYLPKPTPPASQTFRNHPLPKQAVVSSLYRKHGINPYKWRFDVDSGEVKEWKNGKWEVL